MKLAIVILNWNGKKFLEQFLPSLLARTPQWAEIIVADNASTDDSLAFMAETYPDIRIIRNDKNYGFATGYNVALAQVEAEYYCLLNSDIEVAEGWVEPVIELLDSEPQIAAVQPKILSFSDRQHFEYAGACGGYLDKYGYPFCRGRVFSTIEKDNGQYDTRADIFWATGAALFVRSSVYRALGGLDDDFFAHMEEIDLCWRMQLKGWKVTVVPSAGASATTATASWPNPAPSSSTSAAAPCPRTTPSRLSSTSETTTTSSSRTCRQNGCCPLS